MRGFKKNAIIFLAVMIGLIFADFLFLHSFIGGKIYKTASRPLSFATQKITGVASFTKVFIQASKVERENIELQGENNRLIADISSLKEVDSENNILRIRLNIPAPGKRQLIFANVFNLRGGDQLSGFMIDKGKLDGVEEGMAVISPENIMAGIISKVYDHDALVLMPQSKNLSINVSVQGRKVLARSSGNGNDATLEFVTSQDELQKDDVVVTAGFDKIPSAIPIFKVAEIIEKGSGLFKLVKVSPLFDILNTSRVFVIK